MTFGSSAISPFSSNSFVSFGILNTKSGSFFSSFESRLTSKSSLIAPSSESLSSDTLYSLKISPLSEVDVEPLEPHPINRNKTKNAIYF